MARTMCVHGSDQWCTGSAGLVQIGEVGQAKGSRPAGSGHGAEGSGQDRRKMSTCLDRLAQGVHMMVRKRQLMWRI